MHRITIYWKIGTQRVHALQVCEHLPICVSLNGEQYVDVTDEQLEHLKEYERQNLLEFRNKKLIETPHGLQPDVSMQLGNHYHD
ncbi:MAG: hypothetical protein IKB00_06085 [Bacteroidaceae bacterium]|nr:hypothetical protein [Prevotella sp.]MBR2396158.1 hypothetical protein [Bacteroidaceae bacterium]